MVQQNCLELKEIETICMAISMDENRLTSKYRLTKCHNSEGINKILQVSREKKESLYRKRIMNQNSSGFFKGKT